MRCVTGDIWKVRAHWRVVPTNGDVNRRGRAVMGRGIARQAALFYPGVDATFGNLLRHNGNHVYVLGVGSLVTFPVKTHWHEKADLALIERSLAELRAVALGRRDLGFPLAGPGGYETFAVPRVGCGNGGLRWRDVRLVVERYLTEYWWLLVSTPFESEHEP